MGDTSEGPTASESSSSQLPPDDLQCTICLSSEFNQECRVNGCNHSFCFSCISEWVCQSLRPSCPMCRHDIENIFYDFTEIEAKKQIGIKEYRSTQMSISPTDRAQLLGERRLVVRNLMHSYKLLALLASEIAELGESEESKEKNDLRKLEETVTSHILTAEKSLMDLRTEMVRKNKAIVFNTLTFRRIVYTNKIKVKYLDQKREKLRPEDISKDPNRFKSMIINFLLAEFEAIPFQNQPKVAGHKWRTKFLGGTIDLKQKQRYADDIYQLMLSTPTGSEDFQKDLGEILSPVSQVHIRFLDDHLEAIIATQKESIEDFYQEVYYDSIYNSFPNNFFDYNAMLNMRDDPQSRFEAIFSQLHPFDILDQFGRVHRQLSNTDRTDQATNNDGDSDRSSENRTPTPMPEDHIVYRRFGTSEELPSPTTFIFRPSTRTTGNRWTRRAPPEAETSRTRIDQSSRTNPTQSTSRTQMTLRSSTRRDREQRNSEVAARASSSNSGEPIAQRAGRRQNVQELESSSVTLARLFQRPLQAQTISLANFMYPGPAPPTVPVYHPSSHTGHGEDSTVRGRRDHVVVLSRDQVARVALEEYLSEDPRPYVWYSQHQQQRREMRLRTPSPGPAHPVSAPPETEEQSVEQIAAAINQEDADNGLDFISVARRTRAARRAAEDGSHSGAPPPKRSTTSRRGRR